MISETQIFNIGHCSRHKEIIFLYTKLGSSLEYYSSELPCFAVHAHIQYIIKYLLISSHSQNICSQLDNFSVSFPKSVRKDGCQKRDYMHYHIIFWFWSCFWSSWIDIHIHRSVEIKTSPFVRSSHSSQPKTWFSCHRFLLYTLSLSIPTLLFPKYILRYSRNCRNATSDSYQYPPKMNRIPTVENDIAKFPSPGLCDRPVRTIKVLFHIERRDRNLPPLKVSMGLRETCEEAARAAYYNIHFPVDELDKRMPPVSVLFVIKSLGDTQHIWVSQKILESHGLKQELADDENSHVGIAAFGFNQAFFLAVAFHSEYTTVEVTLP